MFPLFGGTHPEIITFSLTVLSCDALSCVILIFYIVTLVAFTTPEAGVLRN